MPPDPAISRTAPDQVAQTPLAYRSLLEIARMIRDRETSSLAVTGAVLDRIAAHDGGLNSYVHVCAERALQQAADADAQIAKGLVRSPLHGVPLAVKDLCFTTFAPTGGGTRIHADFLPDQNATVVDRLETAGAVILGKLTMTEGAYTGHHPDIAVPVNPWSADHWVGSSSTGSGVATAAGLCFGALGSDTGGSIRFPCATCGLTGVKPTWGRVSRHGVFALAASLDHVGPMARSAADCAVMLQAMAGWDPRDPTTLDAAVPDYLAETEKHVRDLRIGIDRRYGFDDVAPEVATALEHSIDVLERAGARFVELSLPEHSALVDAWERMCAIETAVAHQDTYPLRAADYGPELTRLIELGHDTTGIEAAHGHHLRLAYDAALSTRLQEVDCLLCPTLPMLSPSLAEMASFGDDPEVLNALLRYTAPFNFSGHPTVTLPNGRDSAGLPLSMQIVGPKLGEGMILRVAVAFQRVTDWHRHHPATFG